MKRALGASLVGMFVLCIASGAALAQSAEVSRGKYLVDTIGGCGNCHTPLFGPLKDKLLAGGNPFGGENEPFNSFSANLTQDKETGIGEWSVEQIEVAIRQGKTPDGRTLGPPMPIDFYNKMSDKDVHAIAVYLKTVPAVKNAVPKSTYKMPLHAAPDPGKIADTLRTDKLAYGEYLVTIGHCLECHTPMGQRGLDMSKLGAGGRSFKGPWGETVSFNITSHKESGIGAWTRTEIKQAITKGVAKDGTKLRPPMCYGCYAGMTNADLEAVIDFVQTLPPIQ